MAHSLQVHTSQCVSWLKLRKVQLGQARRSLPPGSSSSITVAAEAAVEAEAAEAGEAASLCAAARGVKAPL